MRAPKHTSDSDPRVHYSSSSNIYFLFFTDLALKYDYEKKPQGISFFNTLSSKSTIITKKAFIRDNLIDEDEYNCSVVYSDQYFILSEYDNMFYNSLMALDRPSKDSYGFRQRLRSDSSSDYRNSVHFRGGLGFIYLPVFDNTRKDDHLKLVILVFILEYIFLGFYLILYNILSDSNIYFKSLVFLMGHSYRRYKYQVLSLTFKYKDYKVLRGV